MTSKRTFLCGSLMILAIVIGLTGQTSVTAPQNRPQSDQDAVAQARASADELSTTLRNLLAAEVAAGGPGAAVAACASQAQATTQALSEAKGFKVRRVSLRWRNPADEPDPYEKKVLQDFERSHAQKELPAESVEFVGQGPLRELRFMKPIVLGAMCTSCHGQPGEVPPEVQAALQEKYPNDTATGYRAGDLRGAISVTIPLGAGL